MIWSTRLIWTSPISKFSINKKRLKTKTLIIRGINNEHPWIRTRMSDHTKPTKTTKHIFCAHCGTQNPTDDYACSRCGERLTNSTTNHSSQIEYVPCSECPNTNDARSDYCWVCGAEMGLSIPLANTPNTETPGKIQKQQGGRKRLRPPRPRKRLGIKLWHKFLQRVLA